jgi:hypothetical protein
MGNAYPIDAIRSPGVETFGRSIPSVPAGRFKPQSPTAVRIHVGRLREGLIPSRVSGRRGAVRQPRAYQTGTPLLSWWIMYLEVAHLVYRRGKTDR